MVDKNLKLEQEIEMSNIFKHDGAKYTQLVTYNDKMEQVSVKNLKYYKIKKDYIYNKNDIYKEYLATLYAWQEDLSRTKRDFVQKLLSHAGHCWNWNIPPELKVNIFNYFEGEYIKEVIIILTLTKIPNDLIKYGIIPYLM